MVSAGFAGVQELLLNRNCPRSVIHSNGNTGQRRISWPPDNSSIVCGIKLCSMTETYQIPAGMIILNRAACMGTRRIECYKLPIVEMYQDTWITVGWNSE